MTRFAENRWPDDHDYIFRCECGNGDYLRIHWDEEDKPGDQWACMWIEQHYRFPAWRKRLSMVWKILRGKDVHYTEVLFDKKVVAAMRSMIEDAEESLHIGK